MILRRRPPGRATRTRQPYECRFVTGGGGDDPARDGGDRGSRCRLSPAAERSWDVTVPRQGGRLPWDSGIGGAGRVPDGGRGVDRGGARGEEWATGAGAHPHRRFVVTMNGPIAD